MARIVGSSFFFVCARDYYDEPIDSIKIAEVYLIDLCHMDVLKDGEKDEGFIQGIKGIIAMIEEIR
jgi:hypothetical protein